MNGFFKGGIRRDKQILFAVNRGLKRFGVKLKRANSATRYWPEALDNIKRLGFSPAVIIDVGVHAGTWELYSAFPQSRLVLVEPMSSCEPFLKDIATRFRAEYHLVAAGPRAGICQFNVRVDDKGASSVFTGGNSSILQVDVPMVRLDELLRNYEWSDSALLKIDVEGFELDVIEGCSEILDRFEAIILETRFFKYADGMAEFHEVIARMSALGYVVYDLLDGFYRPQDNVLDLIDILFVKADGSLRRRISRVWSATPDQS
jgi:FkbM family methyltransferase